MSNLVITDVRPTMADVFLSPEALAKRLGFKTQTLANMRSTGNGPRYYKMPNAVVRSPDWAVFDYDLTKVAA